MSKYLTEKKLKMSALFIFEIKGAKEDKIFNFFKGCFLVIGGLMDLIFRVFSEIYARLLKSRTSQFFSKSSKSYNNLNVKSCLKLTAVKKEKQAMLGPLKYMDLIKFYKSFLEWS